MMPLRRKLLSGVNINTVDVEKMQSEINVPLKMNDFEEALRNI